MGTLRKKAERKVLNEYRFFKRGIFGTGAGRTLFSGISLVRVSEKRRYLFPDMGGD